MNLSIAKYSFDFPRRQHFSLPYFIIAYLIETESPHLLQKLQKCCKYFFAKKTILVADKHIRCFSTTNNGTFVVDSNRMKLTLPKSKKWWLTSLSCDVKNSFSTIRPYIYCATLSKLCIWEEDLSLNDINILLSNNKMKELVFSRVNIRDADGTPVPVDYILGKVPNITTFDYYNICESYSNESLEKLKSLNFFKRLRFFALGMNELYFRPDLLQIKPIKEKLQEIASNWLAPGLQPIIVVCHN